MKSAKVNSTTLWALGLGIVLVLSPVSMPSGNAVEGGSGSQEALRGELEGQKAAAGGTRETGTLESQAWLETKKMQAESLSDEQKKALEEERQRFGRALLEGPRKDRLLLGGDFDMTYDSNPLRLPIHHVEGDTLFRLRPFAQIDLSGKKSDVRLEVSVTREYHAKRSEDDAGLTLEGRFRFGRKITKRTLLSLNDRLSMRSERIENPPMDDNSLSLENFHRQALNYAFSRKVSLNLESVYTRTDFQHEHFDQDQTISYRLEPSIFYQPTPKTRFSLGTVWGFDRVRTKTSDTNTVEVRFGYFGQLTPKSSVSADIAYGHQDPEAFEATKTDRIISTMGYVWQATRKTSIRLLYSHNYQTGTSDLPGTSAFANTTTYDNSDTLSISLRFRPVRKISTELSFDGNHTRNLTHFNGTKSAERRLWLFPVQVAMDYQLARWVRLRLAYTYTYQVGDERKVDEFRAHTWFIGSNVNI
jgi:hypothetical protein